MRQPGGSCLAPEALQERFHALNVWTGRGRPADHDRRVRRWLNANKSLRPVGRGSRVFEWAHYRQPVRQCEGSVGDFLRRVRASRRQLDETAVPERINPDLRLEEAAEQCSGSAWRRHYRSRRLHDDQAGRSEREDLLRQRGVITNTVRLIDRPARGCVVSSDDSVGWSATEWIAQIDKQCGDNRPALLRWRVVNHPERKQLHDAACSPDRQHSVTARLTLQKATAESLRIPPMPTSPLHPCLPHRDFLRQVN